MQDVVIEQSKIIKLTCYKAAKFKGTPQAACPFGFKEIQPDCNSCQWLETKVCVSGGGRRLVVDRLIGTIPLDSPQRITDADVVSKIDPVFFQEGELIAPPPPPSAAKED